MRNPGMTRHCEYRFGIHVDDMIDGIHWRKTCRGNSVEDWALKIATAKKDSLAQDDRAVDDDVRKTPWHTPQTHMVAPTPAGLAYQSPDTAAHLMTMLKLACEFFRTNLIWISRKFQYQITSLVSFFSRVSDLVARSILFEKGPRW